MPAGNGFITYSPDTRHGNQTASIYANTTIMERFLLPEGNWQISEIGVYAYANAGYTINLHLGIFTDDVVNGCPAVLVDGTDSGELTLNVAVITKLNHTFSVKPEITGAVGGTYYWICHMYDSSQARYDYIVGAPDISGYKSTAGVVYPTWPTDTQWHTHSNWGSTETSGYAVYEPTSVGSKIMVGSMINIG